MIDLIFIAFIFFVLLMGLRRPFLWVLLYIYIDMLAPQRIGYSIITDLQVSLIAFAAAFGGWLLLDRKEGVRFNWRQGVMLLLLVYCWWTTSNADFPDTAVTKWDWVWKGMLFAIFLPLTLTSRLRIEAAILTYLLSMGMIVVSAGIKVVFGGGGYGNKLLFVNDNSGLYESSVLACMAISIIPTILWFSRHGQIFKPTLPVQAVCYATIFACLLIPVGTEARTGLVCIAVLGLLMFRYMKHKALLAMAGSVAVVVALPFLPASFTDRMSTITDYQEDESASTRIAVWSWTVEYVMANPFGGGFDAFRGNSFTYELPVKEEVGNTTSIQYAEVTDEGRAYHSAIFEVLGEQGWPGLFLWGLIQVGGLWQMAKVRRTWKNRTGEGETWQAPLASALAQAQLIYLVGALFTGIGYAPSMFMLMAFQIGLVTYLHQVESGAAPKKSTRRALSDRRPRPTARPSEAV